MNTEQTIMKTIRMLASKLKNNKLKRKTQIEPLLLELKNILGFETIEAAIIFVPIIDKHCAHETATMESIADYFGVSTLDVMEFIPHLQWLIKRGFIAECKCFVFDFMQQEFCVPTDVFAAIASGAEVTPQPATMEPVDQFDFCETISNFSDNSENLENSATKLQNYVRNLESKFSSIPFVIELKNTIPELTDRIVAYLVCHRYAINKNRTIEMYEIVDKVFDRVSKAAHYKKQMERDENILISKGLIEVQIDFCEGEFNLKPTANLLKMFYGDMASTFVIAQNEDDKYKFVDKIGDWLSDLPYNVNYADMLTVSDRIRHEEDKHADWSIVNKLKSVVPYIENRIIFYQLCSKFIQNNEATVNDLDRIFVRSIAYDHKRQLKAETHPLQKLKLLEVKNEAVFDRAELELTDSAKELFFEEDANLFVATVNDKDLLKPEKIVEKQLFFAPDLQRQLDDLRHSLEEQNYQLLTARLKEKALPTGIAVLLYGSPGTGKTESVMQIARNTSRAIFHVDISQTKTCWFGQSERLIKDVFTKYRRLCERSKLKPILLFNEADAVFSKRKDANSSNVAQTENAIQNIILEEMETLDGILVATTNMASNLDAAFERRFLYKIRFEKPTLEAKKSIWNNKMPLLSALDVEYLAQKFDFSGGEIDNIVRKATVQELLCGTTPNLEALLTLCKEEKINKASKVVGFVQ